jgi:hypothetical protein
MHDYASNDGKYKHEIYQCSDTGDIKHVKKYNNKKPLTKIIKKCVEK